MPPASASNACGLSVKPKQRLSSKTALLTIHSASTITRRLLHQSNFYTRKLLEQRLSTPYINLDTSHLFHPTPLTLDTSYTRHLLHQTPSTPGTFYTKAPFTPNIFYNKQFLHLPPFTSNKPDIFYAKETFALVAFYTRHL